MEVNRGKCKNSSAAKVIIINIYIAQIPCEYDQMRVTNKYNQIKHNKLRIPAGVKLTSWELNSGPPKTNPSSGKVEDLNRELPDYKSSALPLGHARLQKKLKKPLLKP